MAWELPAAGALILLAYFVRGVTGFGSALVAVPMLAHFLPLTLVVPLIVALDVLAALLLTGSGQRGGHVAWREVGWLLPGSLLGIGVGLWLLVQLDRAVLLTTLGVLVCAFGIRQILGLHGERPVARAWALPAGMTGGAIGAVFATGGPPFVIYLSHRLRDKQALRATLSAVFLIDGAVRLAGLAALGLLGQAGSVAYLAVGVPAMGLGLLAGHRVHLGLDPRHMAIVVGGLLVASGTSLLLRGVT